MTGEIEGVPFKIKMDSFDPDEYITDLKYMASLRSPNLFTPMVEYWGYDIQAAVYQEIVRQNIGKRLPFMFDVATKEKPAHLTLGRINQYNIDKALDTVKNNIVNYQKIKAGEIPAERCEDYGCDYCTLTKVITEPIDTDLFGMSAAQLKGMSIYDSCTFASATSALKCTRFGAQEGIPGYEEVLEFMKTHEGVICNE